MFCILDKILFKFFENMHCKSDSSPKSEGRLKLYRERERERDYEIWSSAKGDTGLQSDTGF